MWIAIGFGQVAAFGMGVEGEGLDEGVGGWMWMDGEGGIWV
jgi:hypothetical protein